jgi:Dockerin type I domain
LLNTLSIPTHTRVAPGLGVYLHTASGGGVDLTIEQLARLHDYGADGATFYSYTSFFGDSLGPARRQAVEDYYDSLVEPQPTVLADFNVDEGPFSWPPTFSGSNQNISNNSTIDRVTGDALEGVGAQEIHVVPDGPGDWFLRHVSGNGSAATVASPAGNDPFVAQGFVGFWLKTTDPGVSVQLALDDPGTADRGLAKEVIADGLWHLYEWDLDDDFQWEGWVTGDGVITGPTVTLDSIQFSGTDDATIYLDLVMHNPLGSLLPAIIPGDYNRDGVVSPEDYMTWKETFGQGVAAGNGADGNGDGTVDAGDYTVWRDHLGQYVTPGSGSAAVLPAAVPEPGSVVMSLAALLSAATLRCRCPLRHV